MFLGLMVSYRPASFMSMLVSWKCKPVLKYGGTCRFTHGKNTFTCNFFTNFQKHLSQCRNLLNLTPRFFTKFDWYNLFQINLIFISLECTSTEIWKLSVFWTSVKIYLHSTNYLNISYGWIFHITIFYWLTCMKRLVSSAKWCTLLCWIAVGRSLV